MQQQVLHPSAQPSPCHAVPHQLRQTMPQQVHESTVPFQGMLPQQALTQQGLMPSTLQQQTLTQHTPSQHVAQELASQQTPTQLTPTLPQPTPPQQTLPQQEETRQQEITETSQEPPQSHSGAGTDVAEDSCVFCMQPRNDGTPVESLLCGHSFHTTCLAEYCEVTGKGKRADRSDCCPFKCNVTARAAAEFEEQLLQFGGDVGSHASSSSNSAIVVDAPADDVLLAHAERSAPSFTAVNAPSVTVEVVTTSNAASAENNADNSSDNADAA